MRKKISLSLVFATLVQLGMAQKKMKYPVTQTVDHVDTYFGQPVADPYRWLEDDRSTQTTDWVKRQNEVTMAYLNQLPTKAKLKARLEKLWNYERISAPFKEGKYTYFYRNNGLQNQSVLFQRTSDGTESVFLDPNTFSADGTTSLAQVSFSEDGSKVAFSISEGGSDWNKIIVWEVETKKPIEDTLVDVKFSGISWKGNEGFYYSSYDKPQGSELSAKTDQHKLYYHALGTSQSKDLLIFGGQEKRRYVGGYVSDDGRFLFISASNSTSGNELYMQDLTTKGAPIISIVSDMQHDHDVVDVRGNTLYISTNWKAPNLRVVKASVTAPQPGYWSDVIPEQKEVLSPTTGGGFIFARYMKDALSVVKQYTYAGELVREITLPGLGTASGFGGKFEEETLYFTFTNYVTPASIYSFQAKTGQTTLFTRPSIDFQPDRYESKQVFYTSKDGTRVPMMITYKKGIVLNGKNPTMLYGYGGFNVSLTPSFSVANAVWLENGGVYAVPNLRGGGEYGKAWHDAGTQLKKQNVFDDFIAAGEYLIREKYTSSNYLAIRGGSNGGLLVGAVMTQRPDLMKVALPAVGVLDMLRYHTFTAGAGWAYDYGTAQDSPEMFAYLKGYSPLHHVKPGVKYPATLITTGDHDDRVVPAHSFKFAAALQANQAGALPILIRIETNAGHGAGKPISKTIEENADIMSFTLSQMGVK